MSPTPTPKAPPLVALTLALGALVCAWFGMAAISRDDPWYRNADMNLQNLDDALAINAGVAPNLIDQPGVVPKYLLALDYRARHHLGLLPDWDLDQLAATSEPLSALPPLIQAGRVHQRILVLLLILCSAALVQRVTRDPQASCLAVVLLSGGTGLLFHGLLTRPELHCVWLGQVLTLLLIWDAGAARPRWRHHLGLFVAGTLAGLAALSKLPGVCYLPLGFAACWLAALTAPTDQTRPADGFWPGLLPGAGAGAALLLLLHLTPLQAEVGAVALPRLRLAAMIVAALPLLALAEPRSRPGRFLLARSHEFALLAGGALAALPLCYALLRGVMPEATASDYLARVLHLAFDPAPMMQVLADSPAPGPVFLKYVAQDPGLFLTTPAAVIGLCLLRSAPARLKAFSLLLLLGALGMMAVLSKRHFTVHYVIFYQVPLLLAWAVAFAGLAAALRARSDPAGARRWIFPAAALGALGLLLLARPRLREAYTSYQSDSDLPVSELTLTLLFDHDAHTPDYLRLMRARYGARREFRAVLDRYLSDPANRH